MEISADKVRELREKSGSGIMECKKALVATGGDLAQAVDYLRKEGALKAAKKSGRTTAEGLIGLAVSEDRHVVSLVEMNCETDFVAKTEDCTLDVLKSIISLTKTIPKIVQSDRAKELCGKKTQKWMEDNQITHYLTAADSPQQNGMVERRIAFITQITRALLQNSGMPTKLWNHAWYMANIISNCYPTKALNKTICPYEMAGMESKIHELKVFGCMAVVKIPQPENQPKLNPRGEQMVYLGNAPNTKGMKLMNPKTGQIVVSRSA